MNGCRIAGVKIYKFFIGFQHRSGTKQYMIEWFKIHAMKN